jgi:AraC-like DNA-binding protein
LTVEEIGRHVGMSRARFIRQFHQETGGTPRRFIESCRIEEAIWLLHARNLSVSEIAYACGFQDPARFSRVFKARTGKSPSDLRRPGPGGASLD